MFLSNFSAMPPAAAPPPPGVVRPSVAATPQLRCSNGTRMLTRKGGGETMQQKATTACASSATERAAKHRSERNGASMQGYSHSPTSFCIQHPQPCSQHCAQLTSKALAPPAAPCREMTRNCAACVELSDVLDVPTPYSDVCAVHYAETDWLSVVFVPRCSPSIDRE